MKAPLALRGALFYGLEALGKPGEESFAVVRMFAAFVPIVHYHEMPTSDFERLVVITWVIVAFVDFGTCRDRGCGFLDDRVAKPYPEPLLFAILGVA